jgi:polyisoprenyl-phosphate glycosyltransferase
LNSHTPQLRHAKLSIVVPVYRSEACIGPLFAAIETALARVSRPFELILVNDFSPDSSWARITELCQNHSNVIGINLRKNFGQDNAIITGLRHVSGEFVAIMDDDLQHNPEDLPRLLAMLEDGHDLVYAAFTTKHQSFWKNFGSWFNGKIAEVVLSKPAHIYMSAFKVFRRDLADLVCRYNGPDPYIDGLLFQYSARIAQISATHRPRHEGVSNYTILKSLGVWARLAFGFSIFPLRLVAVFGLFLCFVSAVLSAYLIWERATNPAYTAGYASIVVAILFLGGIQSFSIAIVGEYIGRLFLTINKKPQTSVQDIVNSAQRPLL